MRVRGNTEGMNALESTSFLHKNAFTNPSAATTNSQKGATTMPTEEEYREWVIRETEPGNYEGKSKDTIGVAEGKKFGNTMRMVYDTTISIGETDIRVSFDDRFIKADKNVLINRAEVLKWGVKIADVTIFFSK